MRLKALEIQGFKTFPDKTKLNFTEGITAVVGPNGSGKSNISDAIRWVLGEQSAKALRCSKMEDVIFGGTQQRKKTGFAQVTLSFDNTNRALSFDGDEVAVTRRYYRSGNSEYLINNTAVRLQDIHELFMDTGLGRDGYSMIGQGKIDAIVATKGEDRREIFEEAAGISRFRYKKAEAERRLARTEENLVRLRDVMAELESRVGPLKIQSEKAKAYLEYAEEKRGLEIALWLRTLDRSAQSVREQEDKISVANSQYADIERSLSDIEKENNEIYENSLQCTAKSEQLRRDISEREEKAAESRSEAAVLRSEIRHNAESAARIRDEIKELSRSEEELGAAIVEKNSRIEKLAEDIQSRRQDEQKLTAQLLDLRSGESESADRIAKINAELAELTAKAGDAKVGYITASTAITELGERQDVIENNIKAKRSQCETLEGIIADYRKMTDDCDNAIAAAQHEKDEINSHIAEGEKYCDNIKAQQDTASLASRRLSDKARMLEELERNLEGFAQSVKLVMKKSASGELHGIHGPVSRVIKTDPQYGTAIEIALGAAMQNIVTENDEDAKAAIRYLKQHDGGRATFLPMSTIKGRSLSEQGLESCRGFVGIASALCCCDGCYEGILSNLLGRIVVAEDLDCAVEIAKKYSYRFRVVTLDGQVVNTGGSLTGGSLAKGSGLMKRAGEIEKLKNEAQAEKDKADALAAKLEKGRERLSELSGQLARAEEKLSIAGSDKIKLDSEIRSRKAELDSTRQALEEVTAERDGAEKKLAELTETMEQSRTQLDEYRKKISENEQQARSLTGSKDELAKQREQLADSLQEIKLGIMGLEHDISMIKSEIESTFAQKSKAQQRIEEGNAELQRLGKEKDETEQKAKTCEELAESLSEEAAAMKGEIEALTAKKLQLDSRQSQLRTIEREKTAEREHISGELARLEERRANLQKEYDSITEKLWEEYELTRREAEKCAAVIEEVGKAQKRLSELKSKIKALGNVNVAAIEEYKEVSERYEFMKRQIGDVEKSKNELMHLIGDLTKQMREIFIDRFNMINKNFGATFTELFGGGQASLSLSDPENVLTTGIEISVEPPGKIVSHIELLSGGEKALVAIALYFAIMKVSPAPFCVMDEIEAALDDVNVYRFAEYLRRMNDNTQFICITHRRGTMEEADVLYGVTMQEQGISKLLELHATEIEQKLGMKV